MGRGHPRHGGGLNHRNWIIDVYAAIRVRDTISAMVRGWVTGGRGWLHHRKWLRKEVEKGDIEWPGITAAE